MIVAERVSPTGVVVGQTLMRPQTMGGSAQQSRSSSVGSTTNQGMIVTPSFNPTGVRLPDSILSQQMTNPLADKPNWRTGGRRTSPAAGGFNPQWLLLGGAVLLLIAMGRKKKR